MYGSVAAVRVAVATDLPAIADLLSVVVWLTFQAVPSEDVAQFLAKAQFPDGIDLGVVNQAGLPFFSFLSVVALCVVGNLVHERLLEIHTIKVGSGWRKLLIRTEQRTVLKFIKVLSTWLQSAASRHISIQQNIFVLTV